MDWGKNTLNIWLIRYFGSFTVPSENKRDCRSIEDVQAELREKKKLRLMQTATTSDTVTSNE